MITNRFTLLIFVLGIFPLLVYSQNEQNIGSIGLIARASQNQILLRWAVNEANAWDLTNETGFILEKYIFKIDNQGNPQLHKVWEKKITAKPIDSWRNKIENNDYAAVIAQALFGESFNLGSNQNNLTKIINSIEEREQRFSVSLLAADFSFEAAVLAGWGFVDKEVDETKEYVYKIKVAPNKKNISYPGSAVITKLSDYEPLPSPIELNGIFQDNSVIINWNYELFKNIYAYYDIERAEDTINFKKLNKKPLINLNEQADNNAISMLYVDSLRDNNTKYYYRVVGTSIFGEKGKYSEIISGKGKPILLSSPTIIDYSFPNSNREIMIQWKFPKEEEQRVQKFQLNRAPKDDGPYEVVVDDIPTQIRKIKYSKLNPSSNYFTITAIGFTKGEKKNSFPVLIQPLDSMPPIAPTELSGKIDSTGIVRISWKANTESDLRGYRVFRGFKKKEEPSQLTIKPITEHSFTDTISIKNLNSKVYYQVVAVDIRHNNSEKSEALVLEKPDLVPPSAPIFSNYEVNNEGVLIQWINSTDEAQHLLLRRAKSINEDWKIIFQTNDTTIREFTDNTIVNNIQYQYQIKAIKKSGLSSPPSSFLTITPVKFKPTEAIKGLNSTVDRMAKQITLYWKTNEEVLEYTIYKGQDGKKPTTWQIIPGKTTTITDKDVSPNETYTYYIKTTLKNQKFPKTKTIIITY